MNQKYLLTRQTLYYFSDLSVLSLNKLKILTIVMYHLNNQLIVTSKSFKSCQELRILCIINIAEENPIISNNFFTDIYKHLPKLQYLTIGICKDSVICKQTLSELSKLKHLIGLKMCFSNQLIDSIEKKNFLLWKKDFKNLIASCRWLKLVAIYGQYNKGVQSKKYFLLMESSIYRLRNREAMRHILDSARLSIISLYVFFKCQCSRKRVIRWH